MRRHKAARQVKRYQLYLPMAMGLLVCFFAVFAWVQWIGPWAEDIFRHIVWLERWIAPAYFGLISFLLVMIVLISSLRMVTWKKQAVRENQAEDALNGIFGKSLPGNRFWIWNWQSANFSFAPDWLSSFGFVNERHLQDFLKDKIRSIENSGGVRPLTSWELLVHPEDLESARSELKTFQQNASANATYTCRYRIMDSKGRYRWLLATGRAALGPDQSVLGLAATYIDVTDQHLAEEKLAQEKSFTEGLINSTDLFVLLLDTQCRIQRFNPFAEKITGFKESELIGRSWIDCLFRETEKADMRRLFERVKTNQFVRQKRANIIHKNGQEIELIWHYHPLTDHRGKTIRLAVIGMDVTDRRVLEKQLYELAFFDRLTGLSNQTRLEQQLQAMIRRRTCREESLSIIYFDIDNFKHVNDALGYAGGDDLLKWIADQLRVLIKEPDVVARMGEDEFVLLLSSHRTERSVGALVHELQRILHQPWKRENQSFQITISTGVAFFPQHGSDFKTLLQHASIALFNAKDNGRNQICYYDHQMYLRNLRYIDQVNQLNQAIRHKQFVLHYQLQYDLRSGEARGAEALIRWCHPLHGLISPQSFIPLAEAAGCIDEISKWALQEASQQKHRWNKQGIAIEKVAVNLSSYSFKLDDLTSVIENVLKSSDLPGSEIELEITESALLDNIVDALDKIRRLQEDGITFVLDDFGTGYSSLTYLRQLPVRVIKIDKSFVRTMVENSTDAMIIRAIIDLAHELDLTVVAEGIETHEQMRLLQQYDCDYGQGFLFHHPQAAEQIILHELGHPAIIGENANAVRYSFDL